MAINEAKNIRSNIVSNKMKSIAPNGSESIEHNKAEAYSAQAYAHTITIYHNNAAALADDVTVYEFAANALAKLTLQIGAGNELYDLDLIAHLVRHLVTRRELTYEIDKTAGDNKKSTITLMVDFNSYGFVRPQDTILYNTGGYDHLLTQLRADTGEHIANCTVTKTDVHISEFFKTDVTTLGGVALNKKPIWRPKQYKEDRQNWEIDCPKSATISKIIMYVTEGYKIVTGKIKNINLKSAHFRDMDIPAPLAEALNRGSLKVTSDPDYDGILVLDIAQGEYTEALRTTGLRASSQLVLDVVLDGNYTWETVFLINDTGYKIIMV